MSLYKTILKTSKIISRDRIFVYSAQASFYIIISSIPFIMLLLSLIQYIFPVTEQGALDFFNDFIPMAIKSPIEVIVSEIFHKDSLPIISISAASALWTASRGIAATERGVRSVYRMPERPIFVLNVIASIFYTIIFILIIAVFLGVFVFGNFILKLSAPDSLIFYRILNNTPILKQILVLVIFSIFFTFVYAVFSGRKINLSRHFPGAVFTTAAWILFSQLYSFYISNFANHSYIYGSLTAIVLLMLWIYFCMIIFLLGAELNVMIIIKKQQKIKP